jgi:ribonucleoside-diphosphate reductase alpha chain
LSLGFTEEEIDAADLHICGSQTVEGAPYLKEEHYPIFDCATPCGRGIRAIAPMGHLRIMAAAQPYLSGAISKTVNMAHEASVEDILRIYREGHRLMLKAVAVYRDACKLSQPLNAKKRDVKTADPVRQSAALVAPAQAPAVVSAASATPTLAGDAFVRPVRRRLPTRRGGFVQEVSVGGHKLFLRTGEFPDGNLGEIFIDMYKEGASYRGLLNCFAVLTSKALQYGIPLEELVDTFTFTRFEPAGPVEGHDNIKNCTSILDLIFRTLGLSYLGQTDFVHIKPSLETPEAGRAAAAKGVSSGPITGSQTTGLTGSGLKAPLQKPVSQPEPSFIQAASSRSQVSQRAGYTGDNCSSCGSMRVRRNGTCVVCEDCGTTSGCS